MYISFSMSSIPTQIASKKSSAARELYLALCEDILCNNVLKTNSVGL